MIKKLLLFIIVNVFLLSYANADDGIGMTHEFGLQVTGSYDYNEPEYMHNRSGLLDHWRDNFGLVYNFKNSFVLNDFLTEFEIDTDFRRIKYDYWSDQSGTASDKNDNDTFNLRALYGFQLTDKLMLKSGLGWRTLKDHSGGTQTSTGANGYDRIQEYRYIPILAEINMPIGSIDGKLKLEYDHVFYGYNASLLGQVSGYTDKHFRNDDGYMVKAAYKIPYEGFFLEPYYEFQSIEESNVDAGSNQEPSNTTDEFGIRLTKKFGDDKLTSISKANRIANISDNYYFGFGLMETKVDTGFEKPTGTTDIDEKDRGQKLFAGINLNENLDLEFAFNKFGEAILSCNNTDTFHSDGRYKKKNSSAGTWTCNANNTSINIHSNSVSAAIKPKFKFDLPNDLDVDVFGTIGVTRWDQSETTLTAGTATSAYDYSGYDGLIGIGVTAQKDALTFTLEYQDYDMYYDAKAIGASISYKF